MATLSPLAMQVIHETGVRVQFSQIWKSVLDSLGATLPLGFK